jgi:uncharacterized Zn finger protein
MYYYPPYVSVAQKKARAEKKRNALKKKNPGIQPVIIEGRTLARTWWGKSWNRNLEQYADYANRIGRGRSYVRHGAVLDLQITPGTITALVAGSAGPPYRVTITIQPIPKKQWRHIQARCKDQMDSLKQLLAGRFPETLEAVFTQKGKGLFPAPEEISLDCSCPDWAVMCKHVAAVLYGVGARLDQDPSLFFVLRKADVKDLVSETVNAGKKELLTRSRQKSSRIMEDQADLSGLFGIDLDGGAASDIPPAKSDTPPAKQKQAEKKPAASTRQKPLKNSKDAAGIETLFKRRTKRLTRVAEVIENSDMDPQKVRNILFRLVQLGKLERVSRGVYRWIR